MNSNVIQILLVLMHFLMYGACVCVSVSCDFMACCVTDRSRALARAQVQQTASRPSG
jgi:hypothetical protein